MWYLTLSKQDLSSMIVTEKYITTRRWLMEHRHFLAITKPNERAYWERVFAGKYCQLPCCGSVNESMEVENLLEKVAWAPDTEAHYHIQVDRLMDTAKVQNPSLEVEIEPTSVCIWRMPERLGSWDLRQKISNERDVAEKEMMKLLEDPFSDEQANYEQLENPVRMFMRSGVDAADGTLNVGIPKSCWPILQLGDPHVQSGKVRDFIRIRRMVERDGGGHSNELVAVIAPTSVEWIEEIAHLCVRQGGKHNTNKLITSRGGDRSEEVIKNCWEVLATMANMKQGCFPVEAPAKCPRTLILD